MLTETANVRSRLKRTKLFAYGYPPVTETEKEREKIDDAIKKP